MFAGLVVLALLPVGTLDNSEAGFADVTDNAGNSFVSGTLDPPTGLAAVASGSDIDLSWTVTPDLWATGYQIWRGTTPGCCYALHDTVPDQPSTSYTDIGANASGAVTYESVATAAINSTSIVVTKPTGTADGDLLVAFVSGEDDAGVLSPPGGWTQIFQIDNPGNFVSGAWFRMASGEPASFTFTSTVSHAMNAGVLRYSGADAANPIDVSAAVAAFGNPTAPSVTTTVADTVVLRVGTLENATVSDIDYPAGTTGRVEFDVASGQVTGVADTLQASAGATGTAAFTGTADDYVAATIAIAPGASTTYYYVARAYYLSWSSVDSNEASCC